MGRVAGTAIVLIERPEIYTFPHKPRDRGTKSSFPNGNNNVEAEGGEGGVARDDDRDEYLREYHSDIPAMNGALDYRGDNG